MAGDGGLTAGGRAMPAGRRRRRLWTIRVRLRLVLVLATALLLTGAVLSDVAMRRGARALDALNGETLVGLRQALALQQLLGDAPVSGSVPDAPEDALAALDRYAAQMHGHWQALAAATADNASPDPALQRPRVRADTALAAYRDALTQPADPAALAAAAAGWRSASTQLIAALEAVEQQRMLEAEVASATFAMRAERWRRVNVAVFALGLAVIAVLGLSLIRGLSQGVAMLAQMARAVGRDPERADLDVRLDGELGVVATAVQQLRKTLVTQRHEISGHEQRLKAELRSATDELARANRALAQRVSQLQLLSRSAAIDDGDLDGAARLVLDAARVGLGVGRVGLWLWNAQRDRLECQLQFDVRSADRLRGQVLCRADFPLYFAALDQSRPIVAHDATAHPATREFVGGYLVEHDVAAMLDVPIRRYGEPVGVLCFEQLGSAREWQEDETFFAAALADCIARALAGRERRDALRKLEELNATLEARVRDGTASAEQAARDAGAARRQLQSIAMSIPGVVHQIEQLPDGPLVVTYASGRLLERLFPEGLADGVPAREVIERLIVEEDRAWLLPAIGTALSELRPWSRDFRVRLPDGELRWIHSESIPRREPDGRVVAPSYWSDVTERKRMEQALAAARDEAEVANRAKSAFVATMSHEIRTPMIGVTGMLDVLATTRLDADQAQMVTIIQQSAQALTDIIGDILDFSKIEAGHLELEPATVSIPTLVSQIVANFAPTASSKGLLLESHVDEQVGPAHCIDPLRLRQILSNFLSNAIKFTEAGEVRVEVDAIDGDDRQQTLQFTIRDTGVGLTDEQQRRLFSPFMQGDASTTRRYGGTGLGLSISRRLATAMGGDVRLDSEPGRGTTAIYAQPMPLASRACAASLPEEHGQRLHWRLADPRGAPQVLLVEDHPINQTVLRRQLEIIGLQADVADDGVSALALWQAQPYALLLTDLHMPRMDGVGLTQRIRDAEVQSGTRRLPVLALTAAALPEERMRCLDAGIDDVLIKPVNLQQLSAALRRLLPMLAWVESEAAPALEAAQHAKILDRGVLAAMCAGDPQLMDSMLDDFTASLDEDLGRLDRALAERERAAVMREAHRIKGAARTIGAGEVATAAAGLEAISASEEGDWLEIDAARRRLDRAEARLASLRASEALSSG